jgi:pantoate--beta-alanine ligase
MLLIKTKSEIRSVLSSLSSKESLGLVPTMGALHQGHASLVSKAIAENKKVVVTIFVNPTQFDNKDDLAKYPSTLKADVKILETISKDIIVFAPSATEIYDNDIKSKSYDFEGLDKVMEGAFRAGHFEGVATIVETLLRLIQPTKAYFGEKDFQQLQIIRKIVKSQNLKVQIIGCPIVREDHGLAMSSRNERLPKNLRIEAAFIYKTLKAVKKKFGTKSAKLVMKWAQKEFEKHPTLKLEYISIADAENLKPVQRKRPKTKYRAFIAVYANDIRLIDNIALN